MNTTPPSLMTAVWKPIAENVRYNSITIVHMCVIWVKMKMQISNQHFYVQKLDFKNKMEFILLLYI